MKKIGTYSSIFLIIIFSSHGLTEAMETLQGGEYLTLKKQNETKPKKQKEMNSKKLTIENLFKVDVLKKIEALSPEKQKVVNSSAEHIWKVLNSDEDENLEEKNDFAFPNISEEEKNATVFSDLNNIVDNLISVEAGFSTKDYTYGNDTPAQKLCSLIFFYGVDYIKKDDFKEVIALIKDYYRVSPEKFCSALNDEQKKMVEELLAK